MIAIALTLAAATPAAQNAQQTIELVQCPDEPALQPEVCRDKPADSKFEPIEIPYQAIEAFAAYKGCVLDRFDSAMRSVKSAEEARQAHFDSVAACRDVRAAQLPLALARVTDSRVYGTRAKAQELARLAFDRFDREFDMDWATPSARQEAIERAAKREISR